MHVTNHRVYQYLVYRNELFVKSLTGVPSLSPLPYPFSVIIIFFFAAYTFLRLAHYLNACNRLWKTRSAHHISAGRKRDGYKQLYVSVEFTKYGNTLSRPVLRFQFSHGFL